jgi:hypothetical protein
LLVIGWVTFSPDRWLRVALSACARRGIRFYLRRSHCHFASASHSPPSGPLPIKICNGGRGSYFCSQGMQLHRPCMTHGPRQRCEPPRDGPLERIAIAMPDSDERLRWSLFRITVVIQKVGQCGTMRSIRRGRGPGSSRKPPRRSGRRARISSASPVCGEGWAHAWRFLCPFRVQGRSGACRHVADVR